MLRISSIAYAIIFTIVTYFFHEVIQTTLPEAATAGMATVIVAHTLMCWGYLQYAYENFYKSIGDDAPKKEWINKTVSLILFLMWVPLILVSIFYWTSSIKEFTLAVYSSCIVAVFGFNYKTQLYEEYHALNARRRLTGLKPI